MSSQAILWNQANELQMSIQLLYTSTHREEKEKRTRSQRQLRSVGSKRSRTSVNPEEASVLCMDRAVRRLTSQNRAVLGDSEEMIRKASYSVNLI